MPCVSRFQKSELICNSRRSSLLLCVVVTVCPPVERHFRLSKWAIVIEIGGRSWISNPRYYRTKGSNAERKPQEGYDGAKRRKTIIVCPQTPSESSSETCSMQKSPMNVTNRKPFPSPPTLMLFRFPSFHAFVASLIRLDLSPSSPTAPSSRYRSPPPSRPSSARGAASYQSRAPGR